MRVKICLRYDGFFSFAVGFGGVLLLMGLIIALGTWLPARRAMKLQPAEALHYE